MVAAEAINLLAEAVEEEDSHFSGSSMADGWVIVHRLEIRAQQEGQTLGEMRLLILVQPYL